MVGLNPFLQKWRWNLWPISIKTIIHSVSKAHFLFKNSSKKSSWWKHVQNGQFGYLWQNWKLLTEKYPKYLNFRAKIDQKNSILSMRFLTFKLSNISLDLEPQVHVFLRISAQSKIKLFLDKNWTFETLCHQRLGFVPIRINTFGKTMISIRSTPKMMMDFILITFLVIQKCH